MAYILTCIFFGISFFLRAHEDVIDLRKFESRVYSQQGEDGVIAKIFEIIDVDSKYCVEFGGYDGITASNTRRLLAESNWEGIMFDGSYHNPSIGLYREFITVENINQIFQKYNIPHNLDCLSIDVDFNDFHLWKALDKEYQPRLVVIEYNATFLPDQDKVVPYNAYYSGDGTNYFGASILGMFYLARSKSYSLVYAETNGVNLFFVRDDLLSNINYRFKNVNDVASLYMLPKYGYGPNGGHRQDLFNRPYVFARDLLDNNH